MCEQQRTRQSSAPLGASSWLGQPYWEPSERPGVPPPAASVRLEQDGAEIGIVAGKTVIGHIRANSGSGASAQDVAFTGREDGIERRFRDAAWEVVDTRAPPRAGTV